MESAPEAHSLAIVYWLILITKIVWNLYTSNADQELGIQWKVEEEFQAILNKMKIWKCPTQAVLIAQKLIVVWVYQIEVPATMRMCVIDSL